MAKLRKRNRLTKSRNASDLQLRKEAEKAAQYAPTDEAAEIRRNKEIDEEKDVIMGECEKLGLIMHEASLLVHGCRCKSYFLASRSIQTDTACTRQ